MHFFPKNKKDLFFIAFGFSQIQRCFVILLSLQSCLSLYANTYESQNIQDQNEPPQNQKGDIYIVGDAKIYGLENIKTEADTDQRSKIYISGEVVVYGFEENLSSVEIIRSSGHKMDKLEIQNRKIASSKNTTNINDEKKLIKEVKKTVAKPSTELFTNSTSSDHFSDSNTQKICGFTINFFKNFKFLNANIANVDLHNWKYKTLYTCLNQFEKKTISFDSFSIRPPPSFYS